MTLRRTMAYQIAAMIVALLLLSAASLWGINALHQDFGSAVAGYHELREIYDASAHVTTARTLVILSRQGGPAAVAEVESAIGKFDQYAPSAEGGAEGGARKERLRQEIRVKLEQSLAELRPWAHDRRLYNKDALTQSLDRVLESVGGLVQEIQRQIEEHQAAANRKRRGTLIVMGLLAAGVISGVVVVAMRQYRSVMHPLRGLEQAVRRLAEGDLSKRIEPRGHEEFVSLANDFNTMAGELDELYRNLERKVAEKSKELVRSERLASVGYLAAGVAHEINNPIGIIAGYAEFSQQQLETARPGGGAEHQADAIAEARKAMAVIGEEAFRCKEIVQKLLTLARPGDESRKVIELDEVARSVVSTIRGLRGPADQRLKLNVDEGDLRVHASEGEMKQVVLNLTLNALDAIGGGGEVLLHVGRRGDQVELRVEDSGKGMTPEVLERVFEPFFTAKRGAGQPGTGLGLSITHAIVENHGGRITAHSDGPGRGSRFVMTLPAAKGTA